MGRHKRLRFLHETYIVGCIKPRRVFPGHWEASLGGFFPIDGVNVHGRVSSRSPRED